MSRLGCITARVMGSNAGHVKQICQFCMGEGMIKKKLKEGQSVDLMTKYIILKEILIEPKCCNTPAWYNAL